MNQTAAREQFIPEQLSLTPIPHPGEHAKPLASTSAIRVIGNAAVVQHHGDTDTSVDVFYFRQGHWHAWYSQHSKLEN